MSLTRDPVVTDEPRRSEAVRGLLDAAGITSRRLRVVVALLTESPHTLASLIRESAVERRTVEAILAALGDDVVVTDSGRMRIQPARVSAYRDLVDYSRLRKLAPADPLAKLMEEHTPLVAKVKRWIAELPGAQQPLDHVSATAETVVRRALWLDSTFDLDGARLLCLGDHDLTSLAVAELNPRAEITVVDVDDRILEFIDKLAYPSVRCLWSDFRLGLAEGAREWGDLVFTDPPYTPEGVGLFLARGLEGLRDKDNSRLMLAYGFSSTHPGLGLKAQRAIADLDLVYEALLPDFNRYHGAQAVGSASNLYVLRPTSRSWSSGGKSGVNIYTHGTQSLEGDRSALASDDATALHDAAAGSDRLSVTTVADELAPLASVLTGGFTTTARALAIDLSSDPGGWLARVLLAVNSPRLAVLLPNNHPDLGNEPAQRALTELFAAKWRLRLRRSTPGPRWAIVEADRVDTTRLDAGGRAVRAVVDRAHGKVSNTWREALIHARGETLTKNEARALIHDAAPGAIDAQLISLPRHRIAELPERITRSVGTPQSSAD